MHWSYVFLALTHGLGTLTIIQVYSFYVGQGTHLVLVEKSQIIKAIWSILLKHHFDLKVLDWVLLSWMLSWWCCNNMEKILLTLCKGNPPVTGGFPSQRASNVDLWYFLCCQPEQSVEQTAEWLVIWDTKMLMWCHCSDNVDVKRLLFMINITYKHSVAISISNFN